jgi:hypothetical protein
MMPKLVGADTPVKWISVDDIGVAAAAVFAHRAELIGKAIPLVGDTKSIHEARAIFTKVNGKKPFALSMPTFLFRRFISEDLILMWQWLASHSMDGDVETTRALVAQPLDMETWLRARTAAARSAAA